MAKREITEMTKGEATRRRIIQQALAEFWKSGIHQASLQSIAVAAGLKPSSLFVHYRNTADLIFACLEVVSVEARAFVDACVDLKAPADERFRGYIEGNLLWAEKKREQANVLLALYYLGSSDARLKRFHAEIDAKGIERVEQYVIQGVHESRWKAGDTAKDARVLHDMLIGEMIKTFSRPRDLELRDRVSMIYEASLKVLRG